MSIVKITHIKIKTKTALFCNVILGSDSFIFFDFGNTIKIQGIRKPMRVMIPRKVFLITCVIFDETRPPTWSSKNEEK